MTSAPAFRCSTASRGLAEPQEGTASTVRSFLLVEAGGPWGVEAIRDSRLPSAVKARLTALEQNNRVRPLLIRRPGRASGDPRVRVFAGYVHAAEPWLQTTLLGSVEELLDLELDGLADGRSPGLEPHAEPVFLVCAHGRHDPCCAERGRPLCRALATVAPQHTWEVSHIGGDRFAPNVLVLPYGLYYGRLDVDDAEPFARGHLDGRLDVQHLRGRSSFSFPVQAAEIYLRRELGIDSVAPLQLERHARRGAESVSVFRATGGSWEVRVHTDLGERRMLTCRSAPSLGFSHRVVSIAQA